MNETTTTAVVKGAQAATYGGGGAAFYFGLTASELAALGGLLIGLAGLLISWYYKAQHLKLAREQAGRE